MKTKKLHEPAPGAGKFSRSGTKVIGEQGGAKAHTESGGDLIIYKLSVKVPGKYTLAEPVGQGGMKTILRVEDRDSSRDVAMAVMNDVSSGVSKERFLKEARLTASLEHPNIVPVHEIGVDSGGAPYFTMKLISGEDLATILQKLADGDLHYLSRYSLPHLLGIFLKACDAVDFAHSKGVIHLDLKPENIQIGEFGEVLVLDWGLAKTLKEAKAPRETADSSDGDTPQRMQRPDATMDGVVKGTPGYMAPEQAAGKNSLKGVRTDIYALGAILYSILTFRPPIEGATAEEAIHNTLHGRIIPARSRIPPGRGVPPPLEFVAYKAMERNPKRRYHSVAELKSDIESYLAGYATTAEEAGLFTQIWLLLKRNRAQAILLASALFVIVSLAAYFIMNLSLQRNRAREALEGFKKAEAARTKAEAVKAGLEERISSESMREWQLAFQESFDDGYVFERWKATKGWSPTPIPQSEREVDIARVKDGIKVCAENVINLSFAERIPDDAVKLVYEGTWLGGSDGGLHCVINGSAFDEGYVFQLGGYKNTKAVILRGDGQRILAEAPFSLLPNKRYSIEAQMQRNEGKTELKLRVDGRDLLSASDDLPIPVGPGSSHVGFMVFASSSVFHNMKAFTLSVPLKADLIDVAGRHLGKGNYATAKDLFAEVVESARDPSRKALGAAGLKLATLLEEYKSKIPEWEARMTQAWPEASVRLSVERIGLSVDLAGREISDISPLKGLPISSLKIRGSVKDLGPLSGMELSRLDVAGNKVASLAPLNGMPLESLDCSFNPIGKLDDLSGVHSLRRLSARSCLLSSLDALKGMKLESLDCSFNSLESLEPLKSLPLQELLCSSNRISSLSPLSGLPLESLDVRVNKIQSLKPLSGTPLKKLDCSFNRIESFEPLKGMGLQSLRCEGCSASSLKGLEGTPLKVLNADSNQIQDVSPLESCASLEDLSFRWNKVSRLAPLKSSSLQSLLCDGNSISDLSPLSGMKSLKRLSVSWNGVSSLEPLSSLFALSSLDCSENPVDSLAPLESLALDSLWCGATDVDSFGKLLAFPPRRSFIFDRDSLSPEDLIRLRSSVGAGYHAKAMTSSIDILIAFKERDMERLASLSFKSGGRLFLFIPTLRTRIDAEAAAKSLGGRLPMLKDKAERERLSQQFGVDFWLDLEWRGGRVVWSDGAPLGYPGAGLSRAEGYFLSSSTLISSSGSPRRLLPLLIEWDGSGPPGPDKGEAIEMSPPER